MQKLDYAKRFIDLGIDNGCWAIKFQLFRNLPPNLELPREFFPELIDYAKGKILVFASVFDDDAVKLLYSLKISHIKKAFSMRHTHFNHIPCDYEPQWIVSTTPMESFKHSPKTIKLFCIPEYPVIYKIDFSQIFTRFPFQGFSDHTIGFNQTLVASFLGAEYIEKHITLDHSDIDCPDNCFALKPKELYRMMKCISKT